MKGWWRWTPHGGVLSRSQGHHFQQAYSLLWIWDIHTPPLSWSGASHWQTGFVWLRRDLS